VDLPVPPAPALYKVWRFPLPLVTSRIDVAWKFRWWFDVPGIKGNSAGTVPLRVWSGGSFGGVRFKVNLPAAVFLAHRYHQ